MNIVPIIVWYNPVALTNGTALELVRTCESVFREIIIVDNSAHSNESILRDYKKVRYIANLDNFGIAKALNIGCTKALELNYEWAISFDQDSQWNNPEELRRYVETCEKISELDTNNISFGPNMIPLGAMIPVDINAAKTYEKDKIIWTSGNIFKLSAWHKVEGFNEGLFIDDVDHDFCYSLAGQGYNLIKILNSYMNHELGRHSGVRMYYMVRNCLFMKKKFPQFWIDYQRGKSLRNLFLSRIIRLKIVDLFYMFRGIRDANRGRLGKYAK